MMLRSGTNRALVLWCTCAVGLTTTVSQARTEPQAVGVEGPTVGVAQTLDTLVALTGWSWVDALDGAAAQLTEAVDGVLALAERLIGDAPNDDVASEEPDQAEDDARGALTALLFDGYRDPTERAEAKFIEDVQLADPNDAWALDTPQVASWDLDFGLPEISPFDLPDLSAQNSELVAKALAQTGVVPVPEPTSGALLALVLAAGLYRGRPPR